jgi:hypothetical protein
MGYKLNEINKAKIKHIGTEIYVSNKSYQIAPYLYEKKLVSLLESSLNFCDSINIEIGKVNDKRTEKYQDPERLKEFLERIKSVYFNSLGLKESFENDLENGLLDKEKSFIRNIRPFVNLKRNKKPKIYIRLTDKIPNQNLIKILLTLKNFGFIEAIILDADLDKDIFESNNNFNYEILSESNKKLRLLRNYLGEDFPIISTGSINNGEDIYQRIKNGANFVLINSIMEKRGPYCLEKMIRELDETMKKNNDNSLMDIRKKSILFEKNKGL